MDQRKIVHYGEIYYMDLGQVQLGSRQAGIRPVLVVSSDHRNEYSPVVWVVIITSQIKRLDLKSHVLLPKVKGLPKQSVVEAEQLFTVDKSYLGEYRGKLDEKTMKRVDRAVRSCLRSPEHARKFRRKRQRGKS